MCMHYKLVDEKPKTFVLVFETNDELAGLLKGFASEQKLASASFKAIGALSFVRLGWLNWQTKQYEPSVFLDEQVELLLRLEFFRIREEDTPRILDEGGRHGSCFKIKDRQN